MDIFDGQTNVADYDKFEVAAPHLKYQLTVDGYTSGIIPGKIAIKRYCLFIQEFHNLVHTIAMSIWFRRVNMPTL